jgi:hypothetical protein
VLLAATAKDEINIEASGDDNDPKITQIEKTVFYEAALERLPGFKADLNANKYTASLQKVDFSISGRGIAKTAVSVQPVVVRVEKYSWWGDKGSSNFQPSDITCTIPDNKIAGSADNAFSYPSTRFGSLQTCPDWCKKIGGHWDAAQTCYGDTADGANNNCCRTHWGLKKVCLQVDCTGAATCKLGADHAGCDYGPSVFDDAQTDLTGTAFKIKTTKSKSEMVGTNMMHGFQYAKMTQANFADWDTTASNNKIKVKVRSSKDPMVWLSKESKGCNTGKWDKDRKYSDKTPATTGKSPCFGPTPGQIAATGLVCLILGCIGLIPPCIMVYMIKKMVADKKSKGEFTAP